MRIAHGACQELHRRNYVHAQKASDLVDKGAVPPYNDAVTIATALTERILELGNPPHAHVARDFHLGDPSQLSRWISGELVPSDGRIEALSRLLNWTETEVAMALVRSRRLRNDKRRNRASPEPSIVRQLAPPPSRAEFDALRAEVAELREWVTSLAGHATPIAADVGYRDQDEIADAPQRTRPGE